MGRREGEGRRGTVMEATIYYTMGVCLLPWYPLMCRGSYTVQEYLLTRVIFGEFVCKK